MEHTCAGPIVPAHDSSFSESQTENGNRERVALNGGKHVMLSYNWNSQTIVSKIYQILKDENIPIWFDIQGDMKHNIYESMADGIENAAVVCCFMTPDYQKSENCKLELQYAEKRGKRIIPCMLGDKAWKPSSWLGLITGGEQYISFRDDSAENIRLKARQLIDQIKEQPPTSQPVDEPSYLFEIIRVEYERNNRIERIMNPAKSVPIEQSYINLAIVEIKEQQEKEKMLRDAQHNDAIIGIFEQIYGMKTVLDVKDIFNKCKDQTKNVLVLGRAGIGKSTFCQYVAYKWATGAIWSQYDLLVLIPLRSLTESRYPPTAPGTSYTLIDLVKKEYFGHGLSEKDDRLLREQFHKSQVLWLLDGYDEIVQNVPGHLQYLFEQLLKTPHHIVTSRPYLNKLSYTVQLEITGFTDDNIPEYVKQFFDQTGDATHDSTSADQNLLSFLKLNPSIWGVAHIPINLELICSIWSDTDWSETKTLTMTALYDCITEWLCRRYLTKQNVDIQMTKEDVYADCHKELAFLETLAFKGMENNTIILRKELLQKALKDAECSSKHYARLLNIGILKSINNQSIGNQIEVQKDHYFIHLSFQEHFAARYLVKALNGSGRQTAIDFIKSHKYNQRFQLVFIFTSGLLAQTNSESCTDTFWDIILGEPTDLVGLRHMQLIISCMEETTNSSSSFRRRTELMDSVTKGIIIAVSMKHDIIYKQLNEPLRRSASLVHDSTIQDTLITLLESKESNTKKNVLSLISQIPISNPSSQLIHLLLLHLGDEQWYIRQRACEAFEKMGEKAATNDVMNRLVTALGDESHYVRMSACDTLGKMGEKAATSYVINRLIAALGDENEYVRHKACEALGEMGEKAATNDVINKLVTALEDKSVDVRWRTCEALGKMGEKAATNDVINRLVIALGDEDRNVKRRASEALGKMGEKAATNNVMNRLVTALGDEDVNIKRRACVALGEMDEKAAINYVINRLMTAVGDENGGVRENACKALGQMGEKAATNDVINRLVTALADENANVRWRACQALRKMGDKAPINDVINGLLTALRHEHWNIRQNACTALGEMGKKAATNDMITGLVNALRDEYGNVQEAACKALGEMGEKVANNELINGLVTALGNVWPDVRESARKALGKMGEKAATNDVMNRLVTALGDEDVNVRSTACRALGEMGEKAPTNDVINRLVTALGDENGYVRRCVCEVLGEMGEKAATNDVMHRLIAALDDKNEYVRQKACEALGKMGEKAATIEVITGLVSALGDENWNVGMSACDALGKMGEKAATNNVINGLVTALGNKIGHVRRTACEALGKIGEKAPNNDVINGLVIALWDADMSVRESACRVLGKMNEKAATNDVINGLLNARRRVIGYSSANETLEKILFSFSGLTQLSSDTVSKLFENMKEGQLGALRTVPPDQFVKVFLHTRSTVWLPVVTVVALLQGNAVTVTGNTIVLYGSQEPVQVPIPDEELRRTLVEAFVHQAEELESSSELLAKPKMVSSVCVLM
ncbi:unnamed protein product [Didymodactylos carnosus]|uniref:NACHT domain-containing protein n=1 Tax=Didymodactylos carnosus TaxID=1234261 RepID=A0A8S2HB68_9BILA|nr:unnamed protein product [Didymodactylos carnosus]CAF3625225.1 unnamed protein product [Didymodactylos carnosus]